MQGLYHASQMKKLCSIVGKNSYLFQKSHRRLIQNVSVMNFSSNKRFLAQNILNPSKEKEGFQKAAGSFKKSSFSQVAPRLPQTTKMQIPPVLSIYEFSQMTSIFLS
jgi:hypothetical protein